MSEQSSEGWLHQHRRAEIGAALGTAGFVLAGTAAFIQRRRRHRNNAHPPTEKDIAQYTANLQIFKNFTLASELREVMIQATAHIYAHSAFSSSAVLKRDELQELLRDVPQSEVRIDEALTMLGDLILQRPVLDPSPGSQSWGYYMNVPNYVTGMHGEIERENAPDLYDAIINLLQQEDREWGVEEPALGLG